MSDILKETKIPQTPEQKLAHSGAAMAELKALATPLVEWIRKYHGPHTEIHISWDYVAVKQDDVGLPFPYSEK